MNILFHENLIMSIVNSPEKIKVIWVRVGLFVHLNDPEGFLSLAFQNSTLVLEYDNYE